MSNILQLSIVIIAFNEEERLNACLQSCIPGAEIILLDSQSTDQTVEIAKRHRAIVYERIFDNYADQKNAAISYATRKWILSLDADEVLSDGLKKRVVEIVQSNEDKVAAYRVKRMLVYMGKILRFGKTTDYPIRLFRKDSAKFYGAIHEKLQVNGSVSHIKQEILHYSYKNLDDYFSRFNRYTRLIAENHLSKRKKINRLVHFLRPAFEFVYRYIVRLGFLDGAAGFSYALLSSMYAFVKYEKLREKYLIEKTKK